MFLDEYDDEDQDGDFGQYGICYWFQEFVDFVQVEGCDDGFGQLVYVIQYYYYEGVDDVILFQIGVDVVQL